MAPQLVPQVDTLLVNGFLILILVLGAMSVARIMILIRRYLQLLGEYESVSYLEDFLFLKNVRMRLPEAGKASQTVTRIHPDPQVERVRQALVRANRQNIMLIIFAPLTFFILLFVTNMILYFG